MDGERFDRLARFIGKDASRRGVIKAAAGVAVAAVASSIGLGEAAAGSRLRSIGNSCKIDADCASGLCVLESRSRRICHCASANDCPAAADVCHSAVCLPTGACGIVVNFGAPCDDGNLCTTGDVCQADGSCAGTAKVCTASDACHVVGVCDLSTGTCSNPPAAAGTPCDDGNACTQTDTCNGTGTCVGGNPINCGTGKQCVNAGCFTIAASSSDFGACSSSCLGIAGSVDGSANYLCANPTSAYCATNADCPSGQACSSGLFCVAPC